MIGVVATPRSIILRPAVDFLTRPLVRLFYVRRKNSEREALARIQAGDRSV